MSTALVYRVEHPLTGDGPYGGEHEVMDLLLAHDGNSDHPNPWGEGLMFNGWGDDRCGTATFDGLRRWFSGFLPQLHGAGFVLRVYEVPEQEVQFGEKQVLFNREVAKVIHEQSLIGEEESQWY